MNTLHISSLTHFEGHENEFLMGPWCKEEFSSLDELDGFLCDSYIDIKIMEKYSNDCSVIKKNILPSIALALNKYHDTNYSFHFWEILISNWLSNVINIIHFYSLKLNEIENSGKKYKVLIDTTFPYTRLSDIMFVSYSSEFIHSIISTIIKINNYKNIEYTHSDIIKHQHNQQITSVKKKFTNIAKDLVWSFLKSKNSKYLIYGMSGVTSSYSNMLKIRFKFSEISFSYKDKLDYYLDKEKRESFKIDYFSQNEIENTIVSFINQNIPSSILEGFHTLLSQANDYKNKRVVVASPGFYMDEQLVEVALVAEKNRGKVLQAQEAGNGYSKVYYSSNYLYEPVDYYLTWGWKKHLSYKDIFIPIPSPSLSPLNNIHKESSDKILYQTKYTHLYATLYDSNFMRNTKIYYSDKIKFINELNQTSLKDKLILKLHHSKYKGFDEKSAMDKLLSSYNLYEDKSLNMFNCAILYTDYLSTAMYEAFVANVPIIICANPKVTVADDEFLPYIEKFKKIGIFFEDPIEAARRIAQIYSDRKSTWNSREIQNVRKEFLDAYVKTSKNWDEELFETLKKIERS